MGGMVGVEVGDGGAREGPIVSLPQAVATVTIRINARMKEMRFAIQTRQFCAKFTAKDFKARFLLNNLYFKRQLILLQEEQLMR